MNDVVSVETIQQVIRARIGGHEEGPPFENRGAWIDTLNRAVGAPLGSPWCASAATSIWRGCGYLVPHDEAASCERWHEWLMMTRRWVDQMPNGGATVPWVGWVVLYNFTHVVPASEAVGPTVSRPVAHHMGVVFDVLSDRIVVGEGNTSASPTDREGWIYLLKERPITSRDILGYGMPEPRP